MSVISAALCLLTTVAARAALDEQPYCALRYRRLCQGKGRHVACQFPSQGPGESCQNYHQIHFTQDLKHFITNYINRRRQRLAAGNERVRGGVHLPRPEVMMMVEWDRELSVLAQRLADQCCFVHDDCRATVRYPYSGQTVGEVKWRRFSESDELSAQRAVRRVLDAWWGERRRVAIRQITAPFRLAARGSVWGHFSQLAVWNLRAVGCGAVRHGVEYAKLLLVCDFSHTNMLGQRTITPGPLAPCPIHTVRRTRSPYPLLCAPVRFSSQSPILSTPDDDYDTDEQDDDHNEETIEVDEDLNFTTKGPIELTTMSRSDLFKDEEATRFAVVYKSRSTMRRFGVKDEEYGLLIKEISKSSTSGRMIEELHQELGREDKQRMWVVNDRVPARRLPTYRKWRENQENQNESNHNTRMVWRYSSTYDVDPTAEYHRDNIGDSTMLEHFRQKDRTLPLPTEAGRFYGAVRHRWKYMRDRPQRPGAEALLANKLTNKGDILPRPPEKQSVVVGSLMMDKDDVVQLFRDTGFKPNWRQEHVNKS